VHPAGLSFPQQRRVVVLRDVGNHSWRQIATMVTNRRGDRPAHETCRNVYELLSRSSGRAPYRYENCGRKPKFTPEMKQWVVKRMVALRGTDSCTSTSLRRDLLKHHGVQVNPCTIRRMLQVEGYEWLPRAQKPRHTAAVKRQRQEFAEEMLALTPRQVRAKLALCMDGVTLTMPPADTVARENFCFGAETHAWRTRDEHSLPSLAGFDKYRKQVPPNRAVPLWGGVAAGGFSIVLIHDRRKLTAEEWAEAVEAGKLQSAIQRLNPARRNGPWTVLCDNEAFLRAPASAAAHRESNVSLLKIPPQISRFEPC
jgi:transposase